MIRSVKYGLFLFCSHPSVPFCPTPSLEVKIFEKTFIIENSKRYKGGQNGIMTYWVPTAQLP